MTEQIPNNLISFKHTIRDLGALTETTLGRLSNLTAQAIVTEKASTEWRQFDFLLNSPAADAMIHIISERIVTVKKIPSLLANDFANSLQVDTKVMLCKILNPFGDSRLRLTQNPHNSADFLPYQNHRIFDQIKPEPNFNEVMQ